MWRQKPGPVEDREVFAARDELTFADKFEIHYNNNFAISGTLTRYNILHQRNSQHLNTNLQRNSRAGWTESFRVGLRLWEYQHRLFLNVVMLGSLTARGQSRLQRKVGVKGRYLVRCSPPVRLWPSELFPRDCIGAEPSVITSSESRSRVNETYQRYSASWQIILMTNWPERLCLLSISHYSVSGEGQGLAPSHLSAQKCPEGGEQEMSWSWLWTSLHGLWLHSC